MLIQKVLQNEYSAKKHYPQNSLQTQSEPSVEMFPFDYYHHPLHLCRGKKERNAWFLMHWILGTIISIVGIINIYTGLNAYHKKTSRSIGLWTVLFTAEISFVGFFYLFQDKWEFLQKQGVVLGESEAVSPTDEQVETQRQNSKELLPDPCTKQNALRNLFD